MIVIATEAERTLIPKTEEEVIVTGVGGTNVVKALMHLPKETEIKNYGYAGSTCYEIGEKVQIGKCSLYHPNADYSEPIFTLPGDATCYTSNDFVLSDSYGDCVYDMELAFILALGFTNVTSVKTISDNLNYKAYEKMVNTYGK